MQKIDQNDAVDTITIECEDGTKAECEIMGVFDCDGKEYIALIPIDSSDDVYLYGYEDSGDEGFSLMDIQDDELFGRLVEEFQSIFVR